MKQQRAMKRGKMKKIMKKDNFERFYCEDNGKSELIAVRSLETGEILPVGKDGDKNTGKRLVINQEESYGTPNIYYAENTRDNDGNVGQKLQDKYDGTQSTDVKMRELFNKNTGVYNIEKMHDEAEVHKENKCEELGIDEVDGDLATGHTHNFINENSMIIYNGKEMKVSEVASLPRFNISGEEFARIYNENRLNNEEIEQEEIYDKIEDEVNDDLGMPQERR